MVGKRKPFSAGIPWLYIFLSSAGAILVDIVFFSTFYKNPYNPRGLFLLSIRAP